MYSNFEFQITRDGQADKAIEQWPVPLQGGSIGRSPDCTWVLKDPQRVVSRLHAQVLVENSQCHWTDLGTNSTLVNGKPMPQNQSVPLSPGDVLRIGDYSIILAKVAANWNGFEDLMPRPEIDPLESWLPQPASNVEIDDLSKAISKRTFRRWPSVCMWVPNKLIQQFEVWWLNNRQHPPQFRM